MLGVERMRAVQNITPVTVFYKTLDSLSAYINYVGQMRPFPSDRSDPAMIPSLVNAENRGVQLSCASSTCNSCLSNSQLQESSLSLIIVCDKHL